MSVAGARAAAGREVDLDLLLAPAHAQAAMVRSGEVSAGELVEASLLAIERLDPQLNAFVALVPERALAEAEGVRPGDPRPLCGVPLGLKDFLTATEGLPTTEGSSAFGDWVADHDGAHVRRLRAAGAIVIGKTNTPELASRPVTENERFGATRNPWCPDLTPGGSSGGSAAAVAAGMAPLADGSDFGGSIRIPAACSGLVGLKPSRGRVSIGPDLGDVGAGHVSHGVLTRTVLDTAIALDAIAGPEPGDHHVAPEPSEPFADAAGRDPARVSVRVAMAAPLGVPIDSEPLAAVRSAAELLDRLGHDVHEAIPAWDDHGFPAAWETFVCAVVQQLVTRVLPRLHGRALEPHRLEAATRGWALEREPVSTADYLEAVEHLRAFARRITRDWPPRSVLLTPTLTRLPAAVGSAARAGVTDDGLRFSALVRPWNVTGQPAISLPLAETAAGVPVGVQLVGAPGGDDLLLSLAGQLERAAGWKPTHREEQR